MTTIRSLVDENTWWSLQLDLDKSQAKKKKKWGGGCSGREGDQNSNANEMDLLEHPLISRGARVGRDQVFIFPPS